MKNKRPAVLLAGLLFTAVLLNGCGTIQLIDEVETPAPTEEIVGAQYSVSVTHSDGGLSEFMFRSSAPTAAEALIGQNIIAFGGTGNSELLEADGEKAEPRTDYRRWVLLINGRRSDGSLNVTEETGELVCSLQLEDVDPMEVVEKGTLAVGSGAKWFFLTAADKPGFLSRFVVYTNAANYLDALIENDLVEIAAGENEIEIKEVMGVVADREADGHEWRFEIDGNPGTMEDLMREPERGSQISFIFQ